MAEENHCPECGARLPADAPQGQCPKCLMKLGLPTGADVDKPNNLKPTIDTPPGHTPPGGFIPPAPSILAAQFPQLEIIELLGQGGMGAVYKARQKQLDRLVALKILPPEISQTEAFAERFTREARSLAKLSHPRIVSVYDFGHTQEGLYYFIMEFIDGTDLRHVIQSGTLSPEEALVIVPQICEALQFAHEEGIVHRDVKPENILLDKKGRVKIADFGLAKLLDKPATIYTLTQAGQRMGTPHYMAPEQIEHPGQVDHRADIYSLGVVFYEMLTGELPLGRFPLPSQKVQVDVRLDKVVLHSLEKEPERRYQHASEVKTDVETISAEPKVPMQHPSSAPAPVKRRFSRAAIVGACWAPLFFLVLFPMTLFRVSVQRNISTDSATVLSVPGPGVSLIGLMLILPILLLGVSSVFGTTILGFVSISHIRHSAGRLYGMGLAVFDALFFPLLLLNVVIIACGFFMLRFISVPVLHGMHGIFLAVVVCILLDIFIVRSAWRKANEGLIPIQPDSTFTTASAIPTTIGQESERPYNPTGQVNASPAVDSIQINRMETHVSVVSALRIGFGIMGVLIAIIVFAALVGGGRLTDDPEVMRITSIVGPSVSVFLIVVSLPGIICGVGLLKRRGWARILALILAVPDLVTNIPIGPIIGIYTIWVLLNKETAQLFAHASSSTSKD